MWGVLVCPTGLYAQCGNISFSASDTTGCLNQVIQLISKNVPSNTQYEWTIGGKLFPGKDLDTLTTGFTSTGSFDISLFLKFKNGDSCTVERKNFISVFNNPPQPNITPDKSRLCDINEIVNLTTNVPDMASYTWTVGQSLYRNANDSISHTFIRTGYFDISLQTVDSNGCISTTRKDSLVLVERAPSVSIPLKDTGVCDTFTHFVRPKYNLFGQKGFSYNWKFGGASPSSYNRKIPPKTYYANTGNYGISLKIASTGGCEYDYKFKDSIHVGESKKFNINKTFSPSCNTQTFEIRLTNSVDFPDGVNWLFKGDSIKASYSGFLAKVTYQKSGNFEYRLSSENNGCISILRDSNKANIIKVAADFELDHTCNCKAPDEFITLNTSVIQAGVTPNYEWNVYNSKDQNILNSKASAPKLKINSEGKFHVELIASDGNGCFDTLIVEDAISIKPLNLSISASPEVVCGAQDVQFTLDSACEYNYKQANWFFYNKSGKEIGSASGQSSTFQFPSTGFYDAKVVYETTNGCLDSMLKSNVVQVAPLQKLNFILSDTTICESSVFNGSLVIEPKDLSPSVKWKFQHNLKPSLEIVGKPVVGRQNEFVFRAENSGIYNMMLSVDGGAGCRDSVNIGDFLKVSGIDASIKADNTVGCLPFSTTLRAQVSRNQHPDNPTDASVIYSWRVIPDAQTDIESPTRPNTKIDVYKTGEYNVFLTVENSSGCSRTVLEEDLFKFSFEAGYNLDTQTCQNIKLYPVNTSNGNNLKHTWYSNSPAATFHSKKNAENPIVSFSAVGRHQLSLISELPNGCKDTFTQTINVAPFAFDFSILNPDPKCTPAQYNFRTSRTNVDTLIWEFGDGKSILTPQDDIAHVYDLSTVKPFRNEFNVSLIAKNNLGCIDTLTKDRIVKVLGPNPTFHINNPVGCEPHKVFFTDSTEQVERFFFDFDDGTSVDSVDFSSYEYTIRDSNISKQVFKPFIIAADKNKCFVKYEPIDSITVFSQPIARFSADQPIGCSPHTVHFRNLSKFSTKSYWDFDSDGVIDDSTDNPSFTYTTGVYKVTLIVKNEIGCLHTTIRENYIKVTQPPNAFFSFSDTLLCPDIPVGFNDLSQGFHDLERWKWEFVLNDTFISGSSSVRDPVHKFRDTGLYKIRLTVFDEHGCSDTLERDSAILILTKLPIINPKIDYITIQENQTIEINWNRVLLTGFKWNLLIKNEDETNPLETFTDPLIDFHRDDDVGLNDAPISYRVQLIDKCNNPDRSSTLHRTIHLSVTKGNRPFAQLVWTPYLGWDSIAYYRIFRRTGNEDYSEIKRVAAGDTSYIDKTVCNVDYEYLVSAVDESLKFFSSSNSVKFNPFYDTPEDPLNLRQVSIYGDSVVVRWEPARGFDVDEYQVDKHHPLEGWLYNVEWTLDTFFIDKAIDPAIFQYKYRVRFKDFCNENNQFSNLGSTILLTGGVADNDFVYTWTPYEKWLENTSVVILEQSSLPKGPFNQVTVLPSDATSFVEKGRAINADTSFYVRVKALSGASVPDTSYSNIIKVSPLASLHIPNSFSPNGDGVNDLFEMSGLGFIRKGDDHFSIKIFNRWGELVFESSQYGEFWDGSFNDLICPVGNYLYYLEFTGVDNQIHSRSGEIKIVK